MTNALAQAVGRIQWVSLIGLTVVWVLLWGDLSAGNVIGGLLLATVILVVLPLPSLSVGVVVRPWPTVVLLARFFADMVRASVQVAWLALRPGPVPGGIVVDLRLNGRNELFQTITAEMVALVPGTVVVELEPDAGILTLHILAVTSRAQAEKVRHDVLAQEARVLRALDPDPDASLDPRRRRERDEATGGGDR